MKPYAHIFFDLDGTLTDPGEGITNSVAYALNYFGIETPDRSALYPFIGPPLINSFMTYYSFSREQAEQAVQVYRQYFRKQGMFENRVYDGVEELLQRLTSAGRKLYVASSKPEEFVRQILEHFSLQDAFSFIGGAAMDETRTEKEDVIRYVLAQARISGTENVLMIGDRKFDIEGARAVGIDAAGVTYGYGSAEELRASRPLFTADTPEEIADRLL